MNNGPSHFKTAPSTFGSGRNALLLMAAGWLLTRAWQSLSRARQMQVNARSTRLPERLQTWEGEGGRPQPEIARDPATPDGSNATMRAASEAKPGGA